MQEQLEVARKLKQEKINRIINKDEKSNNIPFKDVTKSKRRKIYNENNNSEKKYKIASIQNSTINNANLINNVKEVNNTDIKKNVKKAKDVSNKNQSITKSFAKDVHKLNDQISSKISIDTTAIFNCRSIPITSSSSLSLLPTSDNITNNNNLRNNFLIQQNLNKSFKTEKFSANDRLNNFRKSIELNQQNSNITNNLYNISILNADINNNNNTNSEIDDIDMTDSSFMLPEG